MAKKLNVISIVNFKGLAIYSKTRFGKDEV